MTNQGALRCPTLITAAGGVPPLRDAALRNLQVIRDGAVAWEDGLVTYAGPAEGLGHRDRVVKAGGAVLPGFVDSHTHLPFFGWRADEFEARLGGRTYRELHGEGGIHRSARLLAAASEDQVMEFCLPLLREMLAHGTTALEMKTGYGLSVEGELRQARLARRLASEIPQRATITLLACHAIPPGRSRERWVREVCDDLIPSAAGDGLVDAVDVYVEDIAFGVEDLERVAEVAGEHGLPVRCHADQMGESGAAEAAVRLGARSADHLNQVSADGIAALGTGDTAAVLLPVSTLVLGANPPPAGELVDAGAALSLATDFNPGTSPCLSMPEVIAVACSLYRLPVLAAIAASTLNPAWVLDMHEGLGSLEPGKRADFVVLETDDVAMIPYRPGHNPVAEVWIGGELARRRA